VGAAAQRAPAAIRESSRALVPLATARGQAPLFALGRRRYRTNVSESGYQRIRDGAALAAELALPRAERQRAREEALV